MYIFVSHTKQKHKTHLVSKAAIDIVMESMCWISRTTDITWNFNGALKTYTNEVFY